MHNRIIIKGARQHNLKNISLEIPKNSLVVITGVSGSGKSTLAFDTLYAEGQRRYVESLSAYARQFLELMEKPDVDSIEYLSPAISIEQKSISKNPRSTVGTITEIYDYLRLLFARVGDVFCPACGEKIESFTPQQITDIIMGLPENTKIEILSPVVFGKKGEFKQLMQKLLKDGFVRAYINNQLVRLEDDITLNKNQKHNISVVVDRLKVKPDIKRRLTDSIETALKLSEGLVEVLTEHEKTLYSEKFACAACNISIPEIEPRTFSFNNPFGACPECEGLGEKLIFDEELIVPDPTKSIKEGAIAPWGKLENFHQLNTIIAISEQFGIDVNKPFSHIDQASKNILMYGSEKPLKLFTFKGDQKITYEKEFKGVIGELKSMLLSEKWADVEKAKQYMSSMPCEACKGTRLKSHSLSVKINGLSIAEISSMTVEKLIPFFQQLNFEGFKKDVADKIIKEIMHRLTFLKNVGIDYITLSRSAMTLSGGESQRIRLATQVGSGLTGVLYVLDEPSIGLHQRDNDMLINTLKNLRDIGNTVIVVEHDEDTIKNSDYIIDMGPGAGIKGGEVVFKGTYKELLECKCSLTSDYLSGRKKIDIPIKKKPDGRFIVIKGAKHNNLKNITVKFPIGLITAVTGVSGSGKSTLVMDILYPALKRKLYGSAAKPGYFDEITGIEYIDKIIDIDQSPIGRTPRSNPATYTGVFGDIREIMAQTPEAKLRGYKQGRFSFNLKGGRCERCQGEGYIKIEMHFLPDMYVKCDVCHGNRYNRDTLDIRYKGKNIAEILEFTVDEAYDFFENIPKLNHKLTVLKEVGLGYIHLGQPATTLSGGEAQRIKLAKELMKRSTGKTLYIFDEPTTGLHFDDVKKLVKIFKALSEAGNSVIIIEHNLDVIKIADYIIDLGPEGGDKGGFVVFEGLPEDCCRCESSYTGKYLKEKMLNA
ncbi:MAG: excinuclease ABC subunit UvrA [Calditerrivibrio sp.]|nr:excinuclease ABC subunit UvrA [Calditerrivibrio sp.]